MKRLVADFDRDFPGIPRTREITALAEEWAGSDSSFRARSAMPGPNPVPSDSRPVMALLAGLRRGWPGSSPWAAPE